MPRALKPCLSAAVVFGAAILAGCAATVPEAITTVEGPVPSGLIARPLEILGVLQLTTTTGNLPSAPNPHFVAATVGVPVGTAVVLPALKGWTLAYGSALPNAANPTAAIDWNVEDHNWGFGSVDVSVVRINPPNTVTQPPTQTAELSLRFYLTDDGRDEPWFGGAEYTLICLGVPNRPLASWDPVPFEPAKLAIQRR